MIGQKCETCIHWFRAWFKDSTEGNCFNEFVGYYERNIWGKRYWVNPKRLPSEGKYCDCYEERRGLKDHK